MVKAGPPNGKKVAIVGSGPAGHSAAYQLARLGYAVTVLEKSPKAGGLNRGGIPDWVLPQEVLDREIERLVELGITLKTNTEVGKDVSWGDLEKHYDACILAVGLTEPNSVRAEGESKEGVLYGLPFLRDIGMGTSKVKLGARVAVIGGGNTAIDCAREALRQGAEEVTMITVEGNPNEMPCVPEDLHDMREEVLRSKLEQMITAGAIATPHEVNLVYTPFHERVTVVYALFDVNDYKEPVSVSNEEAQAFYEQNKESFRTPAQVKVRYAQFSAKDTEKAIKLTDDEIAEYYKRNEPKYAGTNSVAPTLEAVKADVRKDLLASRADRSAADRATGRRSHVPPAPARRPRPAARWRWRCPTHPCRPRRGGSGSVRSSAAPIRRTDGETPRRRRGTGSRACAAATSRSPRTARPGR